MELTQAPAPHLLCGFLILSIFLLCLSFRLSDRANTANASSTSKTTTTTRYHQHAIHVPGTSANLGPGFDVAGIALSLSLDLTVSIPISEPSTRSLPRITYSGLDSANVPLSPYKNLLTRVALYVLRSNGISSFPSGVIIHAHNAIPFGRGLGSSGAAVIAGVLLGNLLGNLNLPKERLLDYALMVERHPDNVSAALMGGFIGSYLAELSPSEAQVSQIPLSEILPEYPEDAGEHWGEHPPAPPKGIGHFVKFGWAKEIKAVAVSPRFELATAKARGVLPESYSRKDVVRPFLFFQVLSRSYHIMLTPRLSFPSLPLILFCPPPPNRSSTSNV